MKQIFINLPVDDLTRSEHFYSQLGFAKYSLFSGENQICMAWGDHILLMLQSKEFFSSGNTKTLADTKNSITTSFTLPVESFSKVNEITAKGLRAGAKEVLPIQNLGFMQVRTIEDLDGHTWGIIHLDKEKFETSRQQL